MVGDALFVSHNSKTGFSINTAIVRTCRPTKGCATYCYGLEGRLQFSAALGAQSRNTTFFEQASDSQLKAAARAVGRRITRKQSFVRMFGVGDLQPGSVKFITLLAMEWSELNVWVSTRKLELAWQLPLLPNLHVMMSCDSTTTAANLEATRGLIRQNGPQFFGAWVRRSEDERPPRWIKVVFEEHHVGKRGRARWEPEPRACPATVRDGLEHEAACEKCTFCFNTKKREKGTALVQLRRR